MAQEFANALEEAGYNVIDVWDGIVALSLQDVMIHDQEFDEVEPIIVPDTELSGELSFGVVDVWRSSNELTQEHETVLEKVGREDGEAYEVDFEELDSSEEIAASIREIHSNLS